MPYQGDTLAGIAEYLGRGKQDNIIVGVASYRGYERLHEWRAAVAAEVHAHVGHVFEHYGIVFGGEASDNLKLFLGQVGPCRIVRVGVEYAGHISFGKDAFEFLLQRGTAVVVDVERRFLESYESGLQMLGRKSGIEI